MKVQLTDQTGRIWADRLALGSDTWTGPWQRVLIVYGLGWQPVPVREDEQ